MLVQNTRILNVERSITINRIFSDNHNWDVYRFKHVGVLRGVEVVEVEKMLCCQDENSGYFVFRCSDCNEIKIIHLGCNSRVCTHCGKHFTDRWAADVADGLFDVVHRHCVFTIPDVLWQLFKENRGLLKELMDCCIVAIEKMMRKKIGRDAKPGIVAVLHTYGKDLKFNPHVHCLITEGGVKLNGEWIDITYFPFDLLRKYWQYEVLKMLKKKLPRTKENKAFIESLFTKYSNGFYVRATDRIASKKKLVRYIGRYIRHPAIAENRIDSYDGEKVTFHYLNDKGMECKVVMAVEEFIEGVIGHIPDRHFKVIRYYGIYARQDRKKYKKIVDWENNYGIITQTTLPDYLHKLTPRCDKCGNLMELLIYEPRKPPDERRFGTQITDWAYIK